MLGTSSIQNRVIDRDEEIGRTPAELSGKRRLAEVLDEVLAHQLPKLLWRNPDTAAATDDFRRTFGGAGHNYPSNLALMGISSAKTGYKSDLGMSGAKFIPM